MRRDYVVVPPNRHACVHVSAQPKDSRACAGLIIALEGPSGRNLCGLEPQLIKLEFIIYLPKLKVSLPLGLGALW